METLRGPVTAGDAFNLVDLVLKQRPDIALSRRCQQIKIATLQGTHPKTELLALLRDVLQVARQLCAPTSQVYVDRIIALQTALSQQLRQSYDRVVAESNCECSTPKIMHDLDGNPLCQHCGRFLPEEVRTFPSKSSHRRNDPLRSQIEYFDSLLDNLEGKENFNIDPDHLNRVKGQVTAELRPNTNPGWTLYLTSKFLREKLKEENLPQYYPHMIKLYHEIVGELPYRQPDGFRTNMRRAFRILLEILNEHFPNTRRAYPFITFHLLRTLYPSDPEIEKLESFYQLDERTFTTEQKKQWAQIRDTFVRQIRLNL